jgi:hypothetical protein
MNTSCPRSRGIPSIGSSLGAFLRKKESRTKAVVFEQRYNSAHTYRPPVVDGERTEAQRLASVGNLASQQQKGSIKGTGRMSAQTRRKVKNCLQRMVAMATAAKSVRPRHNPALGYDQQVCYLTFLTLTLPSDQLRKADGGFDDKQVKALVGRFLGQVERICSVVHYVAVYEAQEGTGNLHAHIVIDKYVENLPEGQNKVDSVPLRLTKLWNQQLRGGKKGCNYIEPYAAKMRAKYASGFVLDMELVESRQQWNGSVWCEVQVPVSEAAQRRRYAYGMATDWQEPNTVDIHALGKAENVIGYISAYMTKDESVRPIEGRLWSHSEGLEKVQVHKEEYTDELRQSVVKLRKQGKEKEFLVTPAGVFSRAEYEDNDLAAAGVSVVRTVHSWKDADWWEVAPKGYAQRHRNHWRDVLRREYGEAKLPSLRAQRPLSRVPLLAVTVGVAERHQPGQTAVLV